MERDVPWVMGYRLGWWMWSLVTWWELERENCMRRETTLAIKNDQQGRRKCSHTLRYGKPTKYISFRKIPEIVYFESRAFSSRVICTKAPMSPNFH